MRYGRWHGGLWIAGTCLGVLLSAPSAQAKGKIVSQWLDREIVIDGELDEWRDALIYFSSVDAFVAMFNDESTLYICLYSQNPEISNQLAMDGLRLRIEGKKSGEFIVHFPRGAGQPDPRARGRREEVDRTPAATDVIELELPGRRDRVTVSAGGEAGLEASVSHRGSFVYELKIPLVVGDSHPWALGLFAGDKFKLLIENPRIDGMTNELAMQGRHRGSRSPFEQDPAGLGGSRRDPGWTGGVRAEEMFLANRFVFLLKARVELAKAP